MAISVKKLGQSFYRETSMFWLWRWDETARTCDANRP
jgi:hypothetical protein